MLRANEIEPVAETRYLHAQSGAVDCAMSGVGDIDKLASFSFFGFLHFLSSQGSLVHMRVIVLCKKCTLFHCMSLYGYLVNTFIHF